MPEFSDKMIAKYKDAKKRFSNRVLASKIRKTIVEKYNGNIGQFKEDNPNLNGFIIENGLDVVNKHFDFDSLSYQTCISKLDSMTTKTSNKDEQVTNPQNYSNSSFGESLEAPTISKSNSHVKTFSLTNGKGGHRLYE